MNTFLPILYMFLIFASGFSAGISFGDDRKTIALANVACSFMCGTRLFFMIVGVRS